MSYFSVVHADNPLHWWRTAEAGGALLHDLGFTPIHLTNTDISKAPMGYSGIAADGGSGYFDSNSGFFHNTPISVNFPASLELWAWFDISADGNIYTLTQWGSAVGNIASIFMDGAGKLNSQFGASAGVSAAALVAQQWTHIVITNTANSTRTYRNGVLDFVTPSVTNPYTDKVFYGRNTAATHSMSGFLTEFAQYGVALSAGQVAAHFAAQEVFGTPVFNQPGNFSAATGGNTPVATDLSAVLAAVRKTFPTT